MAHKQYSREGRHEPRDDYTAISDFLASLTDYTPTIPDELVEHYLAKSGFQCPDVRLLVTKCLNSQPLNQELDSNGGYDSSAILLLVLCFPCALNKLYGLFIEQQMRLAMAK